MTPSRLASFVLVATLLSGGVSWLRDAGYGGPHHDEVIAMMMAKDLGREYAEMLQANGAPLHQVVDATRWHAYTRGFVPVSFGEIRDELVASDRHPPLAFWVMNRWLSLFPVGRYGHAVGLTWLETVVASGILALGVFRATGELTLAAIAFAAFLMGNSAVFTGIWARQYALGLVWFAVVAVASADLVRRNLSTLRFLLLAVIIALASLLGMTTMYAFATLSVSIHLALFALLVRRRQWRRAAALSAAYLVAAAVFFLMLPDALSHAVSVSDSDAPHWEVGNALGGMARMLVPIPSALPGWTTMVIGAVMLALPLTLTMPLMRPFGPSVRQVERADVRVPLAGMLGAGCLQFGLVLTGYFPGWATGPNHMVAFWALTVLAVCTLLARLSAAWTRAVVAVALAGMATVQCLYVWQLHRILPRLNTSYIASTNPDLVCVDNLARGFLLQVTELVPAGNRVLATGSDRLAERFTKGLLTNFQRILYLPMDATVRNGKDWVIFAAVSSGWTVSALPVVHAGLYEAILLESP